MIAQHHGAIVTIASNGSYTGSAGMSAYCASKHAVARPGEERGPGAGSPGHPLQLYLSRRGGDPMIHRIEQAATGSSSGEALFADQYLDHRYCRPDEVAALALYLASDISSHIMGSGIRIDGGLDATC